MKASADAYLIFEQDEIDAVNRLLSQVFAIDVKMNAQDPESAESKLRAARWEFATFARTKLGASVVRLEPLDEGGEVTNGAVPTSAP